MAYYDIICDDQPLEKISDINCTFRQIRSGVALRPSPFTMNVNAFCLNHRNAIMYRSGVGGLMKTWAIGQVDGNECYPVPSMETVQAKARYHVRKSHFNAHCHCLLVSGFTSRVYSCPDYNSTSECASSDVLMFHFHSTFKEPLNNEPLPRPRQIILLLVFFITLWEDLRFRRTRRRPGSDRLTFDHVTWDRHRTTHEMGRPVKTCVNKASWMKAAETATNDLTMTWWWGA